LSSNSADELNCNRSLFYNCTSAEHVCVSPFTNQFMCLPIEKAYDGIADCLGGIDEPQLCLMKASGGFSDDSFHCMTRFRGNCASLMFLCNGQPHCLDGKDEQFCQKNRSLTDFTFLCSNGKESIRTNIENYFCHSLFYNKPKVIYFALDQVNKPVKYPSTLSADNSSIFSNITDLSIVQQQQRRCHRGLVMQVRLNNEKNLTKDVCLCPPTYYGDTCQYQNQRVSLTMNISASSDSWSTLFTIVVSLIDEDERTVSSYEQMNQFTYLSIRDCKVKVHLYLLYATRPKNETRNYLIHIDAYKKNSLAYHASWFIPVIFSFLPVYRITTLLIIPALTN
jgi:hypothetical protein